MISAANKPPQPKATALQGRVKVLEEHNTKLEGYISQLKKVTEMVPNITFVPLTLIPGLIISRNKHQLIT